MSVPPAVAGGALVFTKMAWNDSDFPLAYLISFRTYGTWLHGDERGSIDRHNNIYGNPKYAGNDHWKALGWERMKREPVTLDAARRGCVDLAIRETCKIREWVLLALNIRTNHAHTVSSIGLAKPTIALNAFKSNATRIMRAKGCWTDSHTPWADKGSERWVWTEKHVNDAIQYVLHGQGGDLPKFE